jgi:hypothetical protein
VLDNFKKVENPLTVIAIFAGIAEVASAVALPNLDSCIQSTFVWFLIGFPTLLVLLFFITLNFNHSVLYAPSDYREDSGFFRALSGNNSSSEVRVTAPAVLNSSRSPGESSVPTTQFAGVTPRVSTAISQAFSVFSNLSSVLFSQNLISATALSPQAENIFLLQVDRKTPDGNARMFQREIRIIEARESDETVELMATGRGYSSANPEEFGKKLFDDIAAVLQKR